MKMLNCMLCALILFLLSSFIYAANPISQSAVGYWQTIDDVTNQPKAIVQIWESSGKKLSGRIVKVFPRPGVVPQTLCTACKGEKRNKPIVGMIILTGLTSKKNHPTEWVGGEILDPKNGKVYHCNIKLIDNGAKLAVRGYLGLPLFGRSQTWIRISHH